MTAYLFSSVSARSSRVSFLARAVGAPPEVVFAAFCIPFLRSLQPIVDILKPQVWTPRSLSSKRSSGASLAPIRTEGADGVVVCLAERGAKPSRSAWRDPPTLTSPQGYGIHTSHRAYRRPAGPPSPRSGEGAA